MTFRHSAERQNVVVWYNVGIKFNNKAMLAKKRKTYQNVEKQKSKTSRQIERHLKGVANYRRIEILFVIADNDAINLDGICYVVKGNVKTISEHTKKLSQAGLIRKYRQGRGVVHCLSPYGKIMYKFLKAFSTTV